VLGGIALTLLYVFSPIDRRAHLEAFALRQLHSLRNAGWVPDPAGSVIARVEDQIPGSEGFAVDAGELSFDETHTLGGWPLSRRDHQRLNNASYANLYDPLTRQPLCIALRLTAEADGEPVAAEAAARYADTRVPTHPPQALQSGKWQALSLAPAPALAREHGPTGGREASLSSALVPMPADFAATLWEPLLQELTLRYPRRFEEVWLALGPVYGKTPATTPDGVPLPEAYFAIVLDLTEAGALRAISFLLPAEASDAPWHTFLRPIAEIESRTGLQFLPELRPHTRQSLVQWQATRLW
jgi:endonuclease G